MTFILDSMVRRIAVVIAMGLICGLLFYIAFGNFIVRSIADRRYLLGREAITAAAEKRPNSARINYRLAESELTEPAEPEKALDHASRAVALSPWDYKARRLLASAQELSGQQAEAENSLLAAVKLAPHHAELNSTLANIFIRNGKLEQSLPYFRTASLTRKDILESSFDLVWQASGEDIETLKTMAGTEPELQLALVTYMVDKGRSQDAINVFSAIDRNARLNSPRSGEFINSLIAAGQYGPARSIWVELASAMINIDPTVAGSVWNGGFESDWLQDFGQFDWLINPDKYARIGFDRSERHSGQRSIRAVFAGLDTTLMRDQIRQLIVLKPGVRYRLDCYAKATDLVTPEAPRLAVLGGTEVIASSSPMAAGSTEWKQLTVEFLAPQTTTPKYVSIIRIPKYSYDEETRGTVWFDDFRLTQLGSDGSI